MIGRKHWIAKSPDLRRYLLAMAQHRDAATCADAVLYRESCIRDHRQLGVRGDERRGSKSRLRCNLHSGTKRFEDHLVRWLVGGDPSRNQERSRGLPAIAFGYGRRRSNIPGQRSSVAAYVKKSAGAQGSVFPGVSVLPRSVAGLKVAATAACRRALLG